ncbi:MAG: hypothetical protein O3A53_06045, partial [Acidobacteria bacterium]|nr:hypothetical protein [Acidobacteriota bacterium]
TEIEVCFDSLVLGGKAPQAGCAGRARYDVLRMLLGGSASMGDKDLKNIEVNVAVIDPETVKDTFGRRISRRFVAFQVTVGNNSEDFDFLIHSLNLRIPRIPGPLRDGEELDAQATADELQERIIALQNCGITNNGTCLEYHSIDLALLRGVAEQGQSQHPRNVFMRALEATGAIAGAVVGVANPVSTSWGIGVAAFNGPIVTALKGAIPDHTLNQLNRLNDNAYAANTIIPDEYARVMVGFVPQSMLMSKYRAKAFRTDPYRGMQNFLPMHAKVSGHFITELDDVPPMISEVVLKATAADWEKPAPQVDGWVVGRFLEGSELTVSGPDGVTVEAVGETTNTRINFTLKSTSPIPPNTDLTFTVTRDANETKHTTTVSYNRTPPTIAAELTPADAVQGAGDVAVKIKGTGFKEGATLDVDSGLAGKVDKVDSDTQITATLTVGDDTAAKGYRIRVKVGDLQTSGSATFTVKEKETPTEPPADDDGGTEAPTDPAQ